MYFEPAEFACLWANRPTGYAGQRIFVTDIGYGGSWWFYDGTVWHPANGGVALARSAVASPVSNTTSQTPAATFSVPAGLMGLNHRLAVDALWTFTGSTNSKTARVNFGGTTFAQSVTTTAANVSLRQHVIIANRGAANLQVSPPIALNGGDGFSNGAPTTGSVDTTTAQTLSIAALMASGAETMTLEAYEIRLLT